MIRSTARHWVREFKSQQIEPDNVKIGTANTHSDLVITMRAGKLHGSFTYHIINLSYLHKLRTEYSAISDVRPKFRNLYTIFG